MDFNTGTVTVSPNYTLWKSWYYSTHKVFSSQPDFQLHWTALNNSDASVPQFSSSAPQLVSWQASVSKLNSFIVISSRLSLTAASRDCLNYVSASLGSSLYSLRAAPTENTRSQRFLCCCRGVLNSLLHRNGSSSIVTCVFISVGTCLLSRCLAMNVCSGSAIPAFRRHVAIFYITSCLVWVRNLSLYHLPSDEAALFIAALGNFVH
jgi:hypothetical protein